MAIARKDGIVYTASFDGKIIGWNWQVRSATRQAHYSRTTNLPFAGCIACLLKKTVFTFLPFLIELKKSTAKFRFWANFRPAKNW
jgi:hypothetical protein